MRNSSEYSTGKLQMMKLFSILLVIYACMAASIGRTEVLVYDGMDYSVTNAVNGLNGGTGWRTPWSGVNEIIDPSLKFVNAGKVSTTGNVMRTISDWDGAIRQIDTARYPELLERHGKFGKNGSTVWIGFLIRKKFDYVSEWGGISLFDDSIERVFIGAPYSSYNWGFEQAVLGLRYLSDVAAKPEDTAFICMRILFVDGNDICSLWVNPPLDHQPDEWCATEGEVADFMFNTVRVASSGTCTVDEIRIGTLWQDVMPSVPVITNYVSLQGIHIPPFSSWATAATNIQSAINMNNADIIVVSNGIYQSSAEITITNQLIVTSLNGPFSTFINGNNEHRCVYIDHPDAVLNGFTCSNGYVFGEGGGGYLKNGVIDRCIFVDNSATNGGGLFVDNSGPVYNSLFYHNSAVYGGGICADVADLYNCTIVDNIATNNGGAASYRTCDLRNCIMYYNQDVTSIYYHVVRAFYSCVPPGFTVEFDSITNAPAFFDRLHSNYRLNIKSPCIDNRAGLLYEYYTLDLDGKERILNAKKDAGAFEYGGSLKCYCYVSIPVKEFPQPVFFSSRIEGTNVHDILYEWDFESDGHFDVSGPLLAMVTNVYSEKGIFSVTLKVSNSAGEEHQFYATNAVNIYEPKTICVSLAGLNLPPYTNWHSAAVSLPNALTVAKGNDTILVEAGTYYMENWLVVTQAISIVSVHGPLSTFINNNGVDNSGIKLNHDKATLNGFTVSHDSYVGIYCTIGNIFNCHIKDNYKTGVILEQGIVTNCWIYNNLDYGIHAFSGPNILIENCVVFSNQYRGIYILDSGRINNCIIKNNRYGGIESHGNRSIIIENSVIDNNYFDGWETFGAGLYVSSTTVRNCLVINNKRGSRGGGIFALGDSTVINCTIISNYSHHSGGIYTKNKVYNSIIYDNFASNLPNCFASNSFVNCCIPNDDGGVNIITNEPRFLVPGDYHLRPESPCINTGSNLYELLSDTDLEGTPRFLNDRVDIGAYEYGPLRCAFTANPRGVLTDEPVTFTPVLGGTNLSEIAYEWDFKNGCDVTVSTTHTTLDHAFSNTGYYTVTLCASNANNESWKYTQSNYINVIPEPTLTASILSALFLLRKNRNTARRAPKPTKGL